MKKLIISAILGLGACAMMAQGPSPIRLNQVGYYPQSEKVAVVEQDAKAKSFSLTDAKGKIVWSGKATSQSVSPWSGKVRSIVDFSAVTKPGKYTLRAGKYSQPVIIAEHAMAEVAQKGMKAFYLQRTGMPIEEKYAGVYARPAAHPDTHVLVHPSAASECRPAGTVISSPYGWYDAGDFNKYIVNSGFTIGTLLTAYELYPEYFNQMDLNIPESGDEVPDFLDEIMYNLKWMVTMQDPTDGGVYHKLTTPNFEGFVMPATCKQPRYVMQKSSQAALDFAATLALAARIYKPYAKYQPLVNQFVPQAEKAYAWAVRNQNVLYDQPGNNLKYEPKCNTGMYDDSLSVDEFFWASTELYLSTGQNGYLEQARACAPKQFTLPVWGELAGLGTYEWIAQSFVSNDQDVQQMADALKPSMLAKLDASLAEVPTASFHAPHGNHASDFIWGSNAEMCAGQGLAMMFAHKLTGDARYLTGAIEDANYLLGCNALGYCFVTGFGTFSTRHPHQRLSAADGIDDPLPGFLAGGPNKGQQDKAPYLPAYPSDYPDESYMDHEGSYASNEIAINWNGYLVALMGCLDAVAK